MMDDLSYAPFTGFGDDPATSIKFTIAWPERSEGFPSWTAAPPSIAAFQPLHSNDVVAQVGGRPERELTVRLWLADLDALDALDAAQGAQATLRYRWGLTARAGGTKETRAGRDYLALPATTLVALADVIVPTGGQPEAVATFRRAVGAASLYGYALYSEED